MPSVFERPAMRQHHSSKTPRSWKIPAADGRCVGSLDGRLAKLVFVVGGIPNSSCALQVQLLRARQRRAIPRLRLGKRALVSLRMPLERGSLECSSCPAWASNRKAVMQTRAAISHSSVPPARLREAALCSRHRQTRDGRLRLFQGLKELRLRNVERLPDRAAEIATLVLSHAHLNTAADTLRCCAATGFAVASRRPAIPRRYVESCCLTAAQCSRTVARDLHGYSKHSPPRACIRSRTRSTCLSQFPIRSILIRRPVAAPGCDDFPHAGHVLGAGVDFWSNRRTAATHLFARFPAEPSDPDATRAGRWDNVIGPSMEQAIGSSRCRR